jgi:hypothetical protein
MPETPQDCQHCGAQLGSHSDRGWRRSPHGRPYCPECRVIPEDWQGAHNRGYEVAGGSGVQPST